MSNGHKTNIHKVKVKERKESTYKPHYIPQGINTLPITKISYVSPSPMYMTILISKLLPFFVTSDKG